jgi:hypothetical protein
MVVLLVALVIVAFLAQSALRQYGLLSTKAATAAAKTGAMSRGPAVTPAVPDASEAVPAPTAPIERARSLESQVQRDAQDLSRRIDEQTK